MRWSIIIERFGWVGESISIYLYLYIHSGVWIRSFGFVHLTMAEEDGILIHNQFYLQLETNYTTE
jgi:hypothetical protein